MFTKFTVQDRALAVPKGALMKLTPDQARRRRAVIAPGKGKDVFVAAAACEFKVGEEVQIDLASAGLSAKAIAYISAPAAAAESTSKPVAAGVKTGGTAPAETAAATSNAATANV